MRTHAHLVSEVRVLRLGQQIVWLPALLHRLQQGLDLRSMVQNTHMRLPLCTHMSQHSAVHPTRLHEPMFHCFKTHLLGKVVAHRFHIVKALLSDGVQHLAVQNDGALLDRGLDSGSTSGHDRLDNSLGAQRGACN